MVETEAQKGHKPDREQRRKERKEAGTRCTVTLSYPSQQPSDKEMEAQKGDSKGTWLQEAESGLGPWLMASSLGLSSPLLGGTRSSRDHRSSLFCVSFRGAS